MDRKVVTPIVKDQAAIWLCETLQHLPSCTRETNMLVCVFDRYPLSISRPLRTCSTPLMMKSRIGFLLSKDSFRNRS